MKTEAKFPSEYLSAKMNVTTLPHPIRQNPFYELVLAILATFED